MQRLFVLFSLLLALVFTGCKKTTASPEGPSSGLVGTWRLTERQCFCPGGPVPNETVKFTTTTFEFYQGNSLVSSGTYREIATASLCGRSSSVPGLDLVFSNPSQTPRNPAMRLDGNKLILDYGGPCDALVNTYQRLP